MRVLVYCGHAAGMRMGARKVRAGWVHRGWERRWGLDVCGWEMWLGDADGEARCGCVRDWSAQMRMWWETGYGWGVPAALKCGCGRGG